MIVHLDELAQRRQHLPSGALHDALDDALLLLNARQQISEITIMLSQAPGCGACALHTLFSPCLQLASIVSSSFAFVLSYWTPQAAHYHSHCLLHSGLMVVSIPTVWSPQSEKKKKRQQCQRTYHIVTEQAPLCDATTLL